MLSGLVGGVAGRLQLEGRLLHVEVRAEAGLKGVEDLGGVPRRQAVVLHDHVGGERRRLLERLARARTAVAATLTTAPANATPSTTEPSAAGGASSRRTASTVITAATTARVTPLPAAESVPARANP